MVPLTHKIKIDMVKPGPKPLVNAVQNDANSRAVEISVFHDGEAYEGLGVLTPAVAFAKRDGTKGLYDKLPNGEPAIDVDGHSNTITAILAPQVLTCPGKVDAAVVLFENTTLDRIATFPFTIMVAPDPSAGQKVSNDYYAFTTMEQVDAAVEGWMSQMEDEKEQFLTEAEAVLDTITEVAAESAPPIVAEATGSAITLTDASNRPLRGLTIYGKTTQAETPTKDDPMEMVDVGRRGGNIAMSIVGKNRLPYPYHYGTQTVNGITFTDNGDGSVTANGTAAGNATYYLVHHDNPIYLSVGETYTVSGSPAGAGANTFKTILQDITYSQGANDEGAGATLTAKYTAYYAFIRIMSGTTVNNVTFRPMVEEGAAVTDPERYSAQHLAVPTPNGLPGLPVTSGGNYTDESGQQWTCDAKDISRGVHVKLIPELVLTGEEQWFGNTASYAGWVAAQIAVDAMPNSPVMCTHYEGVTGGMPKAGQVSISSAGSVIIKDADFGSDKTALAAYLAAQYAAGTPVKIRYALADPVETPMDEATLAAYATLRTYKPNTSILNDAGAGMKVEYVADTKAYIDNKFAALTAAIMNT